MKKRSSLLLIELMVSIAVFSIACTIVLQVFAKSSTLSKESMELNYAVTKVENVAEQLKSDVPITDIYFDEDWKSTSKSNAVYCISYTVEDTDSSLHTSFITVSRVEDSSILYSLNYEYTLGGTQDE